MIKWYSYMPQAMPRKQDPQTDGTTERVNQEIEAYLSIYCASHPEEWPQALHTLEFTHNNRCHADRQNTPFELMFGESPLAIPLSFENTKYPSSPYSQRLHCLKQNRQGFRPLQKEKPTAAALTRLSLSHSGSRTVLDIKIIPFP